MATNHTPPATKKFCVWADDVKRVYQDVQAASAKQAFNIAKRRFDCWQPCIEHDTNGLRLSNDVQDLETEEFVRISGSTHCKSCGSEIVETINDSVFRDGECDACEYRRYYSQPSLLSALKCMLEQTVEMDLAHGVKLTEGEKDARRKALTAIAKANG